MAQIRPFAGIRYAAREGVDLSDLIAPPYDVLDEAGKARLQAKHPNNIVTVDLPHLPPKSVGPHETYAGAAATLNRWIAEGVLKRDARPGFYAYTQSFTHHQRTYHRRGFFAAVKLSPFEQGSVVPHEMTYPQAITDRLKLTRATHMQLSPVFGLFPDRGNEVTGLIYKQLGRPEQSATLDGIRHDLWTVTDAAVHNHVADLFGGRSIYIADGHHRYTMALQYQQEMAATAGGLLPPNHPANFCLFVLVPMQDDGLLILPTHRIVGGIRDFDIDAFRTALGETAEITEQVAGEADLAKYVDQTLPRQPMHTFGLFDGRTRRTWQITLKKPEVMAKLEPGHSEAWRNLDVAILRRYLLDEIIKPKFAAGGEPTLAYTADASAVAGMTDGTQNQIALLLRSTPLHALEDLGKTNEVMPQKSTFFYPKLATGLVIHPLG